MSFVGSTGSRWGRQPLVWWGSLWGRREGQKGLQVPQVSIVHLVVECAIALTDGCNQDVRLRDYHFNAGDDTSCRWLDGLGCDEDHLRSKACYIQCIALSRLDEPGVESPVCPILFLSNTPRLTYCSLPGLAR